MKIKLKDIRQATYDANLDTEYREPLAHSLMGLGYISDHPLNLYMGIQEEKEELERVETRPLDSNQISEIIHLAFYPSSNCVLIYSIPCAAIRNRFSIERSLSRSLHILILCPCSPPNL